MNKLLYLLQKFIIKCCPGLKSKYTLRRQLIESYGSTAFISITLVVIFGIVAVIRAGNLVKENARHGLTLQVTTKLHTLNKHTAFVLTEKLKYYRSTSTLLSELVRDRIVGYNGSISTTLLGNNSSMMMSATTTTDEIGIVDVEINPFINDDYVPFWDVDSNQNVYPLRSPLLPNEWNFIPHSTVEDFIESFGVKRATYFMNESYYNDQGLHDDGPRLPPSTVSMKSAMYTYPGSGGGGASCGGNEDSRISSSSSLSRSNIIDNLTLSSSYNPNCTTRIGSDYGVLSLSSIPAAAALTTKYLGIKSADIGVYLKPLYESIPEAVSISVQYHNSGIGSVVEIPSRQRRRRSWQQQTTIIQHDHSYHEEIGCDWANKEINPYTNKPYSTKEETELCQENSRSNEGKMKQQLEEDSASSYYFLNPMEHQMCRNQALNPNSVPIYGPYHDYITKEWVLSIGVAIFDRMTGYFIGCTSIEIMVDALINQLSSSIGTNQTDISLVKFDDGRIVTGAGWDWTFEGDYDGNVEEDAGRMKMPPYVWETGFMDEETFDRMTSIVNWDEEWDPKEIFQFLEDGLSDSYYLDHSATDRSSLFAYPVPVPPKQYDPNYRPEYLLILSRFEEIYDVIDDIDMSIDDDVSYLILITVTIGLVGFTVLTLTIWSVSMMLTRPLEWMRTITWQIVNHNDTRAIDMPEPKQSRYQNTARTETAALVDEFQTMIRGFSGGGASTVAKSSRLLEIRNLFHYHEAFSSLYTGPEGSRHAMPTVLKLQDSSDFDNSQEESQKSPMEDKEDFTELTENDTISERPSTIPTTSLEALPEKLNKGQCSVDPHSSSQRSNSSGLIEYEEGKGIHRSRLFLCIVALIVLPLLLTNIFICGMVAYNISWVLPSWTDISKSTSLYVEEASLTSTAQLVASYAEAAMEDYMRDVHLLTRVSGWLLMGAVKRSPSFTAYDTFVQACRNYSHREEPFCPFQSPCNCEEVNLIYNRECLLDSRSPQQLYFTLQDLDTDPITGNRNESRSYPAHSTTAQTTSWYTNAANVTGAYKGANASGWETSYDRARVISALSAVLIPIYNNDVDEHDRAHVERSGYFAFEADGLFVGYAGCDYPHAQQAVFESAEWNGAHRVRPELCPLGKFGYDPRCRGWYETGNLTAVEFGQGAYVTEPYKFTSGIVGGSAGSAIFDPITDDLIGQTLLDFSPTRLVEHLSNWSDASVLFTFVVVPGKDEDVLIGPGHSIGDDPKAIGDVVVPHDKNSTEYRLMFDTITKKMKNAEQGDEGFRRTGADGRTEHIRLSFAPVFARTLKPVAPDNFERGFSNSSVHLYSIGVASFNETLKEPVLAIQESVNSSVSMLKWLSFLVPFLLCFLVVLVVSLISVQVTQPMVALLHIVRNVNRGKIGDTIPPLEGGSREVQQVYNSFSKLYKIVHVSNTAYFSGNLKWAHHIQTNALQLFRKVNDEKAIAIATNNLANILIAIYREANVRTSLCHEMDGVCCIKSSLAFLEESISLGTREFELGHDDDTMAGLAQQLADRHFNRSLLLLYSVGHPCCPPEGRQLGYSDLAKAKMFDSNVGNYWMAKKLMLKNSAVRFECSIRRIHGLALLRKSDRAVDEVWNAIEVVQEAEGILLAAWDQPTAPLFADVSRVGRLQQFEAAVASLDISAGRLGDAARRCMRLLVEDEYVIASSFAIASDALLRYTRTPPAWSEEAIASCRGDIRSMQKSLSRNAACKSLLFCVDLKREGQVEGSLDSLKASCLALYDLHCGPDDFVCVIGAGDEDNHAIISEFGKKNGSTNQRSCIEEAFKSTRARSAPCVLLHAAQILENNKSRIRGTEAFIVFVTDYVSKDDDSWNLAKQHLGRLNVSGNLGVNVLVVGIVDDNMELEGQCIELTNVSQASEYFPIVAGDEAAGAFENIAEAISYGRRGMFSDRIHLALTMEKF